MSGAEGDAINLFWLVTVLVLAVSALIAHRVSLGAFVRGLIGWAAIVGIVAIVVAHRAGIESFVQTTAERLGAGEQSVDGDTVRIAMSGDGHFWARVSLNGVGRRMLIDSGATITALTPATARRAGIVTGGGFPVVINTANGSIAAERATVARVNIAGQLETRDLNVVVSPAFGSTDVLGMNFLSRLGSWRVEGQTLILEPGRPPAREDLT